MIHRVEGRLASIAILYQEPDETYPSIICRSRFLLWMGKLCVPAVAPPESIGGIPILSTHRFQLDENTFAMALAFLASGSTQNTWAAFWLQLT